MNKNSRAFLKQQLKGNLRYFILAVIFIMVGSFFSFLGPKLIGVVVDSVIGTLPFDLPEFFIPTVEKLGGREFFLSNMWVIISAVATLTAISALCEFARLRASNRLGENLGYGMRQSIFEKLQGASFAYHKNIQTGDIIQRCSSDIDTVRNFVIELTDIVRVVAKITIAYWFMFGISAKLSAISFITVPMISMFSIIFYSKIQKRFLAADEAEGDLQARVQENLSAPRVVRAFGKQKYERDFFQQKNTEFSDMWIKVGNLLAWYWSTGDFLTVLQVVIVLCAGTIFAVRGEVSAGQVITFMVYNGMLAWPVRSLGRIVGNMSKATVAIGRITEIYDEPSEDFTSGQDFVFKGDIEFKNVYFSFEDSPIFKDLSFTVPHGQTVAILGSSGSGKSTILALLARFYPVDSGEITIDGVNIKDINLHTLRRQVGIVMQEPFLFSKTVRENIGIHDHIIDVQRVEESAKIAQVHESILAFEKGYDTLVGEKGVTLSGGQKQRVAIARTLYSGAKILCFDDSLSAVDALTDRNIRAQLKEKISGLTTIIISQRVNTLMQADKILVLDEGKIVQQGSHNQLMEQDGIYKEIVNIQSEIMEKTKQEAEHNE
ncbi:MAG: ABC transporter ATP-binding protein [Oscillospiraceae bacterium]